MNEPNYTLPQAILRLTSFALAHGLIEPTDTVWAANRIAAKLDAPDCDFTGISAPREKLPDSPAPLLEDLMFYAAQRGAELDSVTLRDIFDTELMADLLPRPSEVIRRFNGLYNASPKEATDWYYAFSKATNYIRTDRCAKDLHWSYACDYGDILISVNLSKPEKDPKAIAAARLAPKAAYPACAICRENEGYLGDLNHAARGSHRLIPLTLNNEDWFLQYSPYFYYNEHCIVLCAQHRPMKIDKGTFVRLFDFLDRFPHYFIGSNADLPIVGGSILTHDHFQGGSARFPMDTAPVVKRYPSAVPGLTIEKIKWPLTVLRLRSTDRQALTSAAGRVLTAWRGYTDEENNIYAYTEDTPHNTITPIARRKDEEYELDLVLRNNRTAEDRPLGIFHPAPERHHIKKENIGLIEVMGLAVLPARLKKELALIQDCLLGNKADFYNYPELACHTDWYQMLCDRADITPENCKAVLEAETAKVFVGCLEDCGVFKDTDLGCAGLDRFVAAVPGLLASREV